MNEAIDKEEEIRRLKRELESLKMHLRFLLSVIMSEDDMIPEESKDIIDMIDMREESWLSEMGLDPSSGGYSM